MANDVTRRLKIISEADAVLIQGMSKIERDIFNAVVAALGSKFDISSGRFTGANINEINAISESIRKIILASGYKENVSSYLVNFDTLKTVTAKGASGIGSTASIGLTNIQKGAQRLAVNSLLGTGLDTNLISPIQEIIFNHVQGNATIAEAEQTLRQFILGDAERLGRLERYVGQISRDTISNFDGLMQERIAVEFQLDCISYEGSLITDSRIQCRRWVGKGILKRSELQREIDWAFANGTGMNPATTPDTFQIYRGGFNCRHGTTSIRC